MQKQKLKQEVTEVTEKGKTETSAAPSVSSFFVFRISSVPEWCNAV